MPKLFKIAVFGGLLGLLALLAWGVFRPPPNMASPLAGKPASEFSLETFDGRFPGRFTPAEILVEMDRGQKRFYPAEGRPV